MDRPAGAADGERADLRELDGDAGLRAKERAGSGAARWLLGLGVTATLAANVAHGLGHGLTGAAVAAWPAVALAGSYELLMMIIRSAQVQGTGEALRGTLERSPDPDPLQAETVQAFGGEPAAGRVPSVRMIRAQLHVGQPRAQRLRAYLAGRGHKLARNRQILKDSGIDPRAPAAGAGLAGVPECAGRDDPGGSFFHVDTVLLRRL
jgi:hypothetical protein